MTTRRTMTAAEIQALIGGDLDSLENEIRDTSWHQTEANIVRKRRNGTPGRSDQVMVGITCEGWLEYDGQSIYATLSGCLQLDLEVDEEEGES